VDVATWCPLTTTAAPGSPWEMPLVHSSSDPSSRTLTGLDCFLRDMRTTVMELFCGYENKRRDDGRRGFTFIVCIAIMTVIDNYAEQVSWVSVAMPLLLGFVQNRIWWRKTKVPLLLRADTTNRTRRHLRTRRRRGNPSLVEVGRHLHRRAPVDFRRYCWRCRYNSYAVYTKTKNNYCENKKNWRILFKCQ